MVKVSTPTAKPIKKIYITCPEKLIKDVVVGIKTLRVNNEVNLLYKVSEKENKDLIVTVREKGLIGFFKNLFSKNNPKEIISHEEFEHGLGGAFCSAFSRLYTNWSNKIFN